MKLHQILLVSMLTLLSLLQFVMLASLLLRSSPVGYASLLKLKPVLWSIMLIFWALGFSRGFLDGGIKIIITSLESVKSKH